MKAFLALSLSVLATTVLPTVIADADFVKYPGVSTFYFNI
jgi:hypothetical protein